MSSKLKKQKYNVFLVLLVIMCSVRGFSQKEEDALRFKLAFGVNHAFENGFPQPEENLETDIAGHALNLPTINVGAQYMFNERLGAKLDLGYNRISNANNVPDFKINYVRINAQAVYDYSHVLHSPEDFSLKVHAGPGFSTVKPLGTLKDNKQSYLNVMLGTDISYQLSRSTKVFTDLSFVYGFSNPDEYTPPETGLGAFNGSIVTFTVGVSLSLSGCYFCD